MRRPIRSRWLAAIAFLCAGPAAAQAQAAGSAGPFTLLPEAEEIALARSAAPKEISAEATVYVLRARGFEKVVDGTNGMVCMVGRDPHPDSRYPICYNGAAAETILPAYLHKHQLLLGGASVEDATAEIERGYKDGTYKVPGPSAMSYMMSSKQVIYSDPGADGRRIGAWKPHVMVYMPYARLADVGLRQGHPLGITMSDQGDATAHFVVAMPAWADVDADTEKR